MLTGCIGSSWIMDGTSVSMKNGHSINLQHEYMSSRRRQNEAFVRMHAQPKIRSSIVSDKLQCSTFSAFANDLEGNMIRIGLEYMFGQEVQEYGAYITCGGKKRICPCSL